MKLKLNVNMGEFCYLKQQARRIGFEMEVIKDIPQQYTNGHIAELAFFGQMGYLQKWLGENKIFYRIESDKLLELEDIDCIINNFPIQIKSQYGSYPLINYSHVHTLWLSYDNELMSLDNIKEIINKINLGIEIPEEVYINMMYIWKLYMVYFGII